jgi:hypothetical protein
LSLAQQQLNEELASVEAAQQAAAAAAAGEAARVAAATAAQLADERASVEEARRAAEAARLAAERAAARRQAAAAAAAAARARVSYAQRTIASYVPIIPNVKINTWKGVSSQIPGLERRLERNKTYQPIEALTNISSDRPELIMMTNFEPLFDDDDGTGSSVPGGGNTYANELYTDAGKYADAKLSTQNLLYANVRTLKKRIKKYNPNTDNTLAQAAAKNSDRIKEVYNLTGFLHTLMLRVVKMKDDLDIRNPSHTVRVMDVLTEIDSSDYVQEFITDRGLGDLTIADVMSYFGYNIENVRNVFTPTKVWLQFIFESQDVFESHSDRLLQLEAGEGKTTDEDPTTFNKKRNNQKFRINLSGVVVPLLDELPRFNENNVTEMIAMIRNTYANMYGSISNYDHVDRLAAQTWLLNKEYRYSVGLSKESVQNALQTEFSYTVKDDATANNKTLFQNIFGISGDSIDDIPFQSIGFEKLANTRTLTEGPTADVHHNVLTFESKYIGTSRGIFTPGTEYYVDSMFDGNNGTFDLTNLFNLSAKIAKLRTGMKTVTKEMNLLAAQKGTRDQEGPSPQWTMSDPIVMFRSLKDRFFETNDDTYEPSSQAQDDPIGAFFDFARRNNHVKAALFLLLYNQMTRTYNETTSMTVVGVTGQRLSDESLINVATDNALIEFILTKVSELYLTTPQDASASGDRDDPFMMDVDSVKELFTTVDSYVLNEVKSFMRSVLDAFRYNSEAISSNRNNTKYSGWADTIVLMIAFDICVSVVSSATLIQARSREADSDGNIMWWFGKPSYETTDELTRVENRLRAEKSSVYEILTVLLGTLSSLSGKIWSLINYTNTQKVTMNRVWNVIENQGLVRALYSTQQTMLLRSTVLDLHVNNNAGKTLGSTDIKSQMRHAFNATFSDNRFTSGRGGNKRILTVGVPLGFTEKLKARTEIGAGTSLAVPNKQTDVVAVNVYKQDMLYEDIVFKPQVFLFEMSRFPVRNGRFILHGGDFISFEQVVDAFPTRDLTQDVSDGGDVLTYTPTRLQSLPVPVTDLFKGKYLSTIDVREAFDSDDYAFLTDTNKRDILRNTVMSLMLEIYIMAMTGINVADNRFYIDRVSAQEGIVDPGLVQTIMETTFSHIAEELSLGTSAVRRVDSDQQVSLFSSVQNPGDVPRQKNETDQQYIQRVKTLNLAQLNSMFKPEHQELVIEQLKTIKGYTRMLIDAARPESLMRSIMSPRKFDRVFNVIIDPDDFVIDYDETNSTTQGQTAFEQLRNSGALVDARTYEYALRYGDPPVHSSNFQNQRNYYMRRRDKKEGDTTFEKYFITVSTFNPEVD